MTLDHVTADAHPPGNLGLGQPVDPVKNEGLAAARRQAFDHGHQLLKSLSPGDDGFGLRRYRRRVFGQRRIAFMLTDPALAVTIDEQVAGHFVEQGPGVADRLAAPPPEQARIGLLDQILGLMRVPNGAQEEAEQLVGVLGRHVGIG